MYIERNIEKVITKYMDNYIKPIVIQASRQVGKKTTIKKVLEMYKYVYINLFENKNLNKIFSAEVNTDYHTVISALEDELSIKITDDTVLFIDEIEVNYIAFSALKMFNEAKRVKVICSGSNIAPTIYSGVKYVYPVGQIIKLEMYPLSFSEFLTATDNRFLLDRLLNSLKKKEINDTIHTKALKIFDKYLEIGGLPEVVTTYINGNDYKLIQDNLCNDYVNNFAKYASNNQIKYLKSIYKQIPQNLGRENQIFKFSDLGYESKLLKDSLEWLNLSRMTIFCYKINSVRQPIDVNIKENKFKLFLNDTGLLVNKQNYNISSLIKQVDKIYLGEVCENYIATVLHKYLDIVTYFNVNKIEIDFVFYLNNKLSALEIKASYNTKSKALTSFSNKYNPVNKYKLSRRNLEFSEYNHMPIYALDLILENNIEGYFDNNG